MESGWIVNYDDGRRILMNESAYEEFKDEGKIKSTEHWFDLSKAENENPGIEILAL